ncbi:MAG: LacI family DNA-binding transcriptional regulator [Lentisphaeria bacterium]|nr:LacI family DNA-binding transcriptional regulator [Lentisphaeria bacterium]
MSVTIKSIAAEAGVSFQAVSAVLNNKTSSRVSPATRERILDIAGKRGYKVNFGYRIMHGHKTRTVGIISAMRKLESDAHVRELILKLMQRLNLAGYATYFNNMMTIDAGENLEQIRELISRGTEHFIFIGSPRGHEVIEEEICRRKCTLIGWNSNFKRSLQTDSCSASAVLQNFLLEKSGEIPWLMLPGEKYFPNNRFVALRKFYPEMSEDEVWDKYVIQTPELKWDEIDFADRAFELGFNGIADHMAKHPETRAVACFTDHFALGVASWCNGNGVTVGKDIFIAGFNNIEAVRFYSSPVSSAEHPVNESIEILLHEMDKDLPFNEKIKLKVILRD